MNIRVQHIAIAIGTILLMTFLFFKTNVIDSDEHNRFISDLRHLKELGATLDKDILEARYGLSNSYDLLMSEVAQINQLQSRLKAIPGFVNQDEQKEIKALLDKYTELQTNKNQLIEQFKSRNAIINNSLRYFPVATSQLIKKMSLKGSTQKEIESLNYLLRDILIYYLLTETELEPEINTQIASLQEFQKNRSTSIRETDLDISVSHAHTILKIKPQVDELVKQTVSIPTSNQVEELIKLYDKYYSQAVSQANFYRLFLYIFSIILLAYISYIIVRLKKATSELNVVNESLEQRVEVRTAELVSANESMQIEVNERKRAEGEVSEAQHFLRKVINTVPNLIFVRNNEGEFTLVNQAFADMWGRPVEDIIGKTSADFVKDPEEIERIRLDDRQVLDTAQEKIIPEDKVIDSKGGIHWFHTVKRQFISTDKNMRYLLGVATDLTERKLLEDQLQRAQKLESIGQLAAGIAHEINTPTQFVGDNTRFLKDSFQDFTLVLEKNEELFSACRSNTVTPELLVEMQKAIDLADIEYLTEEVPKAIGQALEGVSRISKIVQSMKDFAHPGSVDKKAIDLSKAIESTITVASNEWKYVAEVETEYDESLPTVPCFIGEFNQVILNMIINAAHAIVDVVGDGSPGCKGKIRITTKRRENWAEIRISDTGAGIPLEIRQKIFDPFFTTKEVGKGTGQGLAISYGVIVEKHKGTIEVESEPGKGTTFIINIPIYNMADNTVDALN